MQYSKRNTLMILLFFMLVGCTQAPTATPSMTPSLVVPTITDTLVPTQIPPTATFTEVPATATDTATATATDEPTATTSLTPTNTPGPLADYPTEGYGPHSFPENINPLTGLAVANPELLNRRPIAIKVSNGPRSVRPQWGLSFADHVFEYYQERGRTRFHAIFYGNDVDQVGPIRSARFADVHFVEMYKSIFAYGSADARVLWRLFDTGYGKRFASITDHQCPPTEEFPLCRTDPNGYNYLVANTALFSQKVTDRYVENGRQNLNGLIFQAAAPEGGEEGISLALRYSNGFYNRWDYDSAYGKYVRYQDTADDPYGGSGEEYALLTDQLTGEPIRADNVVVLLVSQTYFLETPEMWEVNLIGYGNAYLYRDGKVYPVIWTRQTETDLITLRYDDGSQIPLRPGTTWFQIIGKSSLSTNEGGIWRFDHLMP